MQVHPEPFGRRLTHWLAENTPTWVIPVAMLAVIAHWAVYYLGVIGILAWYGIKALWQAIT